jgi:uroporphyrinogen III methyltransferase/synthase
MTEPTEHPGLVVLIGAGPGDSRLLTVEGLRWISIADTVIYDRLAGRSVIELADEDAETIYVGKAPGAHSLSQDEINELMVAKARAGALVARVKGGDPFIFGRGGEEALALSDAGVPFRIVPGVTAAAAAAASAGIPLTHRGLASSVTLVTGHEDPAKTDSDIDYAALARLGTLVFYMGVSRLGDIVDRLIDAGRPNDTPAALVRNAALPDQNVIQTTLEDIPQAAAKAGITPPALLVVGEVAALTGELNWSADLPLAGQCVLVTRPAHQSEVMSVMLTQYGARVLEAPAVEIRSLEDTDELDRAILDLPEFDWLVFTSSNGVRAFEDRLRRLHRDGRSLGDVRIAAVGPGTASALEDILLTADLVPESYTTEELGRALGSAIEPGERALLLRADLATVTLPRLLEKAGADVREVAAYRTARPSALPEETVEALHRGRVDWLTVCSASSVDNIIALARDAQADLHNLQVAAIGPVTARALHEHGLEASIVAREHTVPGLVQALVAAAKRE